VTYDRIDLPNEIVLIKLICKISILMMMYMRDNVEEIFDNHES